MDILTLRVTEIDGPSQHRDSTSWAKSSVAPAIDSTLRLPHLDGPCVVLFTSKPFDELFINNMKGGFGMRSQALGTLQGRRC